MLFSWDPAKAERNLAKHGISFELAQTVFDDPLHDSIVDWKREDEQRWITMGQGADHRILVVVHTYRVVRELEMVRLIAARRATRKEIRQYEEGI